MYNNLTSNTVSTESNTNMTKHSYVNITGLRCDLKTTLHLRNVQMKIQFSAYYIIEKYETETSYLTQRISKILCPVTNHNSNKISFIGVFVLFTNI